MKKSFFTVALASVLAVAQPALAEQSRVNRAAGGVADAVTSPVRVFEGISQHAQAYGPVGVVSDSVKGGVRAAGQPVAGAANFGVVQAMAEPFTH
jgi:hypothetical protein